VVSKAGESGLCKLELSTIKKVAKTKAVCFDKEIPGTTATTPKTILGSSPGEDVFCSSKTKHDRRMAQRTKFLSTRLRELWTQTRKLSWVRASVKMLVLGVIIIIIIINVYDIQRYVSNDQAHGKLLGNKD
jgi:hypothetical protein